MRLAILANTKNSFPKVMAAGLKRMLSRIGVESSIFHHGLDTIANKSYLAERGTLASRLRLAGATLRLKALAQELMRYDAIVIVGHVCELQACGSVVFSPYAEWCPSHWMKGDITIDGPGQLSDNFRIYNNDPKLLVSQLRELTAAYDAERVRQIFLRDQPQFFAGALDELQCFIDLLGAGKIRSNLNRGI